MLKQNTRVRAKVFQPEGVIIGGTFVDGVPQYLVEFVGEDGETHQRHWPEEYLEEVPAEPSEPAVEPSAETPAEG